jgi:hypothetical protein
VPADLAISFPAETFTTADPTLTVMAPDIIIVQDVHYNGIEIVIGANSFSTPGTYPLSSYSSYISEIESPTGSSFLSGSISSAASTPEPSTATFALPGALGLTLLRLLQRYRHTAR